MIIIIIVIIIIIMIFYSLEREDQGELWPYISNNIPGCCYYLLIIPLMLEFYFFFSFYSIQVAGVVGRADLACAFCVFLSFLMYTHSCQEGTSQDKAPFMQLQYLTQQTQSVPYFVEKALWRGLSMSHVWISKLETFQEWKVSASFVRTSLLFHYFKLSLFGISLRHVASSS